ncbi:hypothetical protein ACYB6X_11200, partial [Klebsiella pneumoniae]
CCHNHYPVNYISRSVKPNFSFLSGTLYGQNAYHLTFLKHRFDFDHISILICMTQKQIAIK